MGKLIMAKIIMKGLTGRIRSLQDMSCGQLSIQGRLIVIEGTDGSGKATHSKIVFERLMKEGISCEHVDFPQYGKPSAAMIEKYLNGELGPINEISPKAASIFYALDRFEKSRDLWKWLKEGKIIICNRYSTSNKGHQAAKIREKEKIDEFLEWLDDLEYNTFGIPRPDKVIFIHMPAKIGQSLVDLKGKREYTNGKKKDAHESDLNHLECAERAYIYVAKKEGWQTIEASDGKKPYSIEENAEKVYKAVKEAIR
jgi:dTMP kinase